MADIFATPILSDDNQQVPVSSGKDWACTSLNSVTAKESDEAEKTSPFDLLLGKLG